MTRWVAIFEDHPEAEKGWIRQQHSQDHFAYLAQNCGRILLAGGLRNSPDEWYGGGLWVLEVKDRNEAVSLCEQDPYFRLGLRRGYQLYLWGKAPCYGDVQL
ncbi:YciI family protein [Bradyrhizobium tropiciagri]|uniref:YciI family protein n=1 Tax=Bradyrhizobium tropiciagri TaxID=312253 RepID=UPI000AD03F07